MFLTSGVGSMIVSHEKVLWHKVDDCAPLNKELH